MSTIRGCDDPGSLAMMELKRVCRRPHYRVRDGALYFLASTRPVTTVSNEELATWEALATGDSRESLRRRVGPGADAAIARFLELGLCDEVGSFPPGRRRAIVVEPHSDDAALSVGGTMWLRRNELEFDLVTVASRSNFTSYFLSDRDFLKVEEVTAIRNAEGAALIRQLGGSHRALGENEATLRYRDEDWSLQFLRSHRVSVSAFNNRQALESDLARWKAALRPVFEQLDGAELWLPLGIGNHSDHELARNASLSLLAEDPDLARTSVVRLYQDVPYDSTHIDHLGRVLRELTNAGAIALPEHVSIKEAYQRKLELLSVYASQFKVPAIEHGVDASSRVGAHGQERLEHLYRLERPPGRLSPLRMTLDAPQVQAVLPDVRRWLKRHARAPLIRILAILPPGRWHEDVRLLAALFPAATFELYAPPAAAAEADEVHFPRVEVHHVPAGAGAWARTALRLALRRPSPTLILSGPRYLEARLFGLLWPLSDTIVVRAMDHFMLALNEARRSPGTD